MTTWLNKLQNQSLLLRASVLGAAEILEFAVVAPVAYALGGVSAVIAAAVAALLCLTGATLALITSHLLRGPQLALLALLVGMTLRLSIPLGTAVAIHCRGGLLADAGLLYYLLVFYLVTLTVETLLSLPPRRPIPTPARETAYNAY